MSEKEKEWRSLTWRSVSDGHICNRTRIPDTDSNLYRTVSGKFWICYPGFRNPCSHCTAEYLACALCDRTSWSGCFQ